MRIPFTCLDVALVALGEPHRRVGQELFYPCPRHDDQHPSFQINQLKDCWICGPCGAGGGAWAMAAFVAGFDPGDKPSVTAWAREHGLLDRTANGSISHRAVPGRKRRVAEFPYGHDLRKVRIEPGNDGKPKSFIWEHHDGDGWKPGDGGKVKSLYANKIFREADQLDYAVGFEGEAKCDLAGELGIAGFSFKDLTEGECKKLQGLKVILWRDRDASGTTQAEAAAQKVHSFGEARTIEIITPPAELPDGGDIVDAVHTLHWGRKEIEQLIAGAKKWGPPVPSNAMDTTVTTGVAVVNDDVILPSADITIKATAGALFERIGLTNTMFIRGGAVTRIVQDTATSWIEVISPAAARSRFESYAKFLIYRAGRGGELVLKPTIIAQDMAAALLETEEARAFLPQITGLINCPVIAVVDGNLQIVGKGYHPQTGLFVTNGRPPEEVSVSEGKIALREFVSEFDFQSPGDRSRALASCITPALKLGGHIQGSVPVDVAEADQSQAGKTFRQKLVAAIYNEKPMMVTCRNGGVGSVDETLDAQLIAGRPFIQLDNFRGKFDSPHVEALLTAERSFPVRVPYSRGIVIDPSKFFLMLTSNGVETTRDFANRASIVRIRKREGHTFRQYSEGDLLDHVRARQPYYLGAVFAIVRNWIERGRPRSSETRHDFREWARSLDWIVQNILGEAPLMDGHQAAQERVSNPDLTFLRKLALAVTDQNQLGDALIASALYEIADGAGIDIPGLREPDEDRGKRMIGTVMARLFKTASMIMVDAYTVTRREEETPRIDGGGSYPAKKYIFERAAPRRVFAQAHKAL